MGSEGGKNGLTDVFFKGCVEELSNENRFALAAGEVKSTGWRSGARWLHYFLCCYTGIYAVSRAFLPQGCKCQGFSVNAFAESISDLFRQRAPLNLTCG